MNKFSLSLSCLTLVAAGSLLAADPAPPGAVPAGAVPKAPGMRDANGKIQAPDGLARIQGAMRLIKNGKVTLVSSELKLSEGLIARPNGEVVMPDGKTITLTEGQLLTLDGKMTQVPVGLGSTAPGSASTQPPDDLPAKTQYGNGPGNASAK